MTEYVCTCDAIGVEQKHGLTTASPHNATTLWNDLRQLIETIGAEALAIYRYHNDPQPQFSQGGARVLIRPDRIDLV